jgi:2-oxoglutarate ferredoxin oxidoreductase subunit beta
MADTQTLPPLKAKDFASSQDIRWCPGCGDYAILKRVQKVAAELGWRPEKTVFVSGIGCAARFPYYMNTYGFHSIHGRAPSIATGVKLANPDLNVWIVGGDGDMLSIGGNHLMHFLRRNVNAKLMLFNNRIYGLTKGQYSPTSETGKKTSSSPDGSLERPINPILVALASEAAFVGRAIAVDHDLGPVLERAAAHRGAAIVEIYQDCNVFNHKTFHYAEDKDSKEDNLLRLEHGKPMIFGEKRDKGIRLRGARLEAVSLDRPGNGISVDDLLVHDETDPGLAMLLARMRYPDLPEPIGVFHALEHPTYDDLLTQQVDEMTAERGKGSLESLFNSGDVYTIAEQDTEHGSHL